MTYFFSLPILLLISMLSLLSRTSPAYGAPEYLGHYCVNTTIPENSSYQSILPPAPLLLPSPLTPSANSKNSSTSRTPSMPSTSKLLISLPKSAEIAWPPQPTSSPKSARENWLL
ncbi:hypothetical protein CFP56_015128 [Quercus suber]|uniref:Uncharacterized protein n=1 Tax=Quercus suber TaxID=58331 RepID=A0AAW0KS53_QUESU